MVVEVVVVWRWWKRRRGGGGGTGDGEDDGEHAQHVAGAVAREERAAEEEGEEREAEQVHPHRERRVRRREQQPAEHDAEEHEPDADAPRPPAGAARPVREVEDVEEEEEAERGAPQQPRHPRLDVERVEDVRAGGEGGGEEQHVQQRQEQVAELRDDDLPPRDRLAEFGLVLADVALQARRLRARARRRLVGERHVRHLHRVRRLLRRRRLLLDGEAAGAPRCGAGGDLDVVAAGRWERRRGDLDHDVWHKPAGAMSRRCDRAISAPPRREHRALLIDRPAYCMGRRPSSSPRERLPLNGRHGPGGPSGECTTVHTPKASRCQNGAKTAARAIN